MNRIRKRKLLRKLRSNLRRLGHSAVDQMDDQELLKLTESFGTLEQMVALSDPGSARALQLIASMGKPAAPARTLSREDVQAAVAKAAAATAPTTFGTHDQAGELILLKGGPMDDYLVREGAPCLEPNWRKDGRYDRDVDVRAHGDDPDTATAVWRSS